MYIWLLLEQGDNNIGDAGATAVLEMLKFNSALTEINLVHPSYGLDVHTLILSQDRLKRFMHSKANNVGPVLKQQIEALVKRNRDEPQRARDEVAPFKSVVSWDICFVVAICATAAVILDNVDFPVC